jgi:hypothetical protein
MASPERTSILRLDRTLLKTEDGLAAVRDNLSAIAVHRNNLWLGGDEGTSIHRLTRDGAGNFSQHQAFETKSLLQLPIKDSKSEIDIEGLDINGGYLWLIGSHSLKRKKPEKKKTAAENIERLAEVKADGNRFTLGRLPLSGADDSEPAATVGHLTAARLEGDSQGNLLTRALSDDIHVGRFAPRGDQGVPSKDNGVDIEGLAVSESRAFIGLRGPVLRGWSLILEIQLTDSRPGVLGLEPFGSSGRFFRKHFLELDGLGIRDLAIHDRDLFILAGPTMNLDGPTFLYRWKKALDQTADSLIWRDGLPRVLEIPHGNIADKTDGKDHAEGIALLRDPLSVMVCYDSPSDARIDGEHKDGVIADIFEI